VSKNNRVNDGAAVSTSWPQMTVQNSSVTTAQSPLVSKPSDTDRVLRRNGAEFSLPMLMPEASRNSSNISIRFSKKVAEDSEDESVLAIKIPPPAVPLPPDVELSETG